MWSWLAANLATVLICLALAGAVTAIIVHLVRRKQRGESSCGCGCGGCPMRDSCHKK